MRPALPAIRMQDAGRVDVLTLADLYAEHGHPCVGTGIAFRAVRAGIATLYGDAVPRRDDLLVFSRIAGPGVLETIDRLMSGAGGAVKTVAPPGMRLARENFVFSLYRKSTGEMVSVGLRPEVLSEDFFPLKSRMKKQGLSPEQWQILHGHIRQAVGKVLGEADERLFEVTRSKPLVMWEAPASDAGGTIVSAGSREATAGPGVEP